MKEQVEGIKKFLMSPVMIAVGIAAGLLLAWFIYKGMCYVSTDDAFIDGDVVSISPKVSAHVVKVLIDDNQAVTEGSPLVELDPNDFDVRVQMAAADLEAAKAEDEQAAQDARRYEKLGETDEVSKQQMDRAVLRARTAAAKLASAKAALRKAELDLSYTKIASPTSGHVARRAVEVGAFVQPGQALLAVVSDKKWVVANFKETSLTRMHAGQDVSVRVDTYPGKVWKAHVDSIQRGTGSRFSLFPPENATGNFVKVVQRVPVKIVFDEPLEDRFPLSVGMSVIPEVKVR